MQKVFAVRDVKADAFQNLIVCPTRGLATRAFVNAVVDPSSPMGQCPEDYMLYELGTYEPNSGKLEGHAVPFLIMSATEAIQSAKRSQEVPA